MEYFITWEIELDANTPEEAAAKALSIQRDPNSTGVVFDVYWNDKSGRYNHALVDLLEQP